MGVGVGMCVSVCVCVLCARVRACVCVSACQEQETRCRTPALHQAPRARQQRASYSAASDDDYEESDEDSG